MADDSPEHRSERISLVIPMSGPLEAALSELARIGSLNVTSVELLTGLAQAALRDIVQDLTEENADSLRAIRERRVLHIADAVFPLSWPSPKFIAQVLGLTERSASNLLTTVAARNRRASRSRIAAENSMRRAVKEGIDQAAVPFETTPILFKLSASQAKWANERIREADETARPIMKVRNTLSLYSTNARSTSILAASLDLQTPSHEVLNRVREKCEQQESDECEIGKDVVEIDRLRIILMEVGIEAKITRGRVAVHRNTLDSILSAWGARPCN